MTQKEHIERILIIDDQQENIAVLSEILEEYVSLAALNGKKGLAIASREPLPDLILLDIMMPDMDGYEVIQKLKDNKKTKEIPVIFLTAMSDASDEIRGLELGAVDYITKPVSPPAVRARIKNHLELKRSRELLKQQNQELLEAAKLRDDVDRIVRHDLKSPLSSIIGNAQLITISTPLTDNQKNSAHIIETEAYRMLDMINRSMDIYKMERGIYEYKPVRFDMLPVIRKVIEETEILAQAFEVDIQISLNGKSPGDTEQFLLDGEEFLCHSLLANLVKNAIEASPDHSTVQINLRQKQYPVIAIHNQGAVPESIRHNFFEKYVTAGKERGIGIGTYSAKLIVEAMQGKISMETSDKNGTTITLEFLKS